MTFGGEACRRRPDRFGARWIDTVSGKQAADLSTRYFECLRNHSGSKAQSQLVDEITVFRKEHPKVFDH